MPAAPLRFLTYVARSTGHDLVRDLADIGQSAQRNNAEHGITGMLVHDHGHYVQLLEGPPESLEHLLGNIRRDPRCDRLRVIRDEPAERRRMDAWRMLVLRIDDRSGSDPLAAESFRDAYQRIVPTDADGLVGLLKELERQGVAQQLPVPSPVLSRGPLRLHGYTARYTGHDIATDLAAIARVSHARNPRHGITGALVYDAGRFVQMLEGPEGEIDALMARIRHDPRCAEIVTLYDHAIEARSMGAWAMLMLRTDAQREERLETFRSACRGEQRPPSDAFVAQLRGLIVASLGLDLLRP